MTWVAVTLPDKFHQWWHSTYGDVPVPNAYERSALRALVGREPTTNSKKDPDLRWHLSVSREDRLPTWGEMVGAAHDLRPGVVFVIPVPPRSWWINVHPHTLHMWETTDMHLANMWRSERRGMQPT